MSADLTWSEVCALTGNARVMAADRWWRQRSGGWSPPTSAALAGLVEAESLRVAFAERYGDEPDVCRARRRELEAALRTPLIARAAA